MIKLFNSYDKRNPSVGDVNAFRTIEFLLNQIPNDKGVISLRRSDFKIRLFKAEKFNHHCPMKIITTFTRGGTANEEIDDQRKSTKIDSMDHFKDWVKTPYINANGNLAHTWVKT